MMELVKTGSNITESLKVLKKKIETLRTGYQFHWITFRG